MEFYFYFYTWHSVTQLLGRWLGRHFEDGCYTHSNDTKSNQGANINYHHFFSQKSPESCICPNNSVVKHNKCKIGQQSKNCTQDSIVKFDPLTLILPKTFQEKPTSDLELPIKNALNLPSHGMHHHHGHLASRRSKHITSP